MPTYVKIIIGFVVLAGIAYAADMAMLSHKVSKLQSTEFDFRQAKWGMSLEEVVESETLELDSEYVENYLFYDEVVMIADLDSYVGYFFENDKLIHGYYLFDVQCFCPDLKSQEIDNIKDYLKDKYGPPLGDIIIDVDNETIRSIQWETKSSRIVLSISKPTTESEPDNEYTIDIVYMDKDSVSFLEIFKEGFTVLAISAKKYISQILTSN